MAGKLFPITLNVLSDFGNWAESENFNWGAYADALVQATRDDLIDDEAHVTVNFVQSGEGILFDGVEPEYGDMLFRGILERVDATEDRFYTQNVR